MVLQLTNNFWELKLDTIFDANISQHLLGTFNSPYIIINVTSDDTLTAWKQAGSVGQAITFEGNLAYGEVTNLTLNTFTLLQFSLLSGTDYKLYYFPLPRLVNSQVKVWAYLGETIDTTINDLAIAISNVNIEVNLSSIEKDLALIKNALGIRPLVEPTPEEIEFFLFN